MRTAVVTPLPKLLEEFKEAAFRSDETLTKYKFNGQKESSSPLSTPSCLSTYYFVLSRTA